MWTETIQIIKDWIVSGVYKLSATTYQSHWFRELKQDGKSLHLMHKLQPLNVVTIHDLSMPPFVEHLAESFTRCVVYGIMDLFTGYDQHPPTQIQEPSPLSTFLSILII